MAKETRVGVLVLASLVIAGVAVFLLGRQQHLWERKVDFTLHFARTNGLQTGAPVSLSGLPIGSVDWLHFASEADATDIVVGIEVDAKVATRIRTDTRATIRTLGLLGDKYIELVPGGDANADAIPSGGRIATNDPTDYEALVGKSGGDIVSNVVEVTAALKDVLQTIQRGEGLLGAMLHNRQFGDETLENLQGTLTNIRETTDTLDGLMKKVEHGDGLVGRLLHDKKLAESLDRSLTSLEHVTNRVEHGHGLAMRLVDDQAYADRVLAKLDRASDDLAAVAQKLNGTHGTLGKLINEPTLHDQTSALVQEVRGSWMVRLYEAFRGLWPSDGNAPAPAPGATGGKR